MLQLLMMEDPLNSSEANNQHKHKQQSDEQ